MVTLANPHWNIYKFPSMVFLCINGFYCTINPTNFSIKQKEPNYSLKN